MDGAAAQSLILSVESFLGSALNPDSLDEGDLAIADALRSDVLSSFDGDLEQVMGALFLACMRVAALESSVTKEMAGQKFGKWLVVGYSVKSRKKWRCVCDCGTERDVSGSSLRNGSSQSCGCVPRSKKHGQCDSSLYKIWGSMIQRCVNPNSGGYENYGGRGIGVCERWRKSFVAFKEDMGDRPTDQHSLDRIDNNAGYCKENCRWSTKSEQARNTRQNRNFSIDGETLTLAEWCERHSIKRATVVDRLRRGWGIERALVTPVRKVVLK